MKRALIPSLGKRESPVPVLSLGLLIQGDTLLIGCVEPIKIGAKFTNIKHLVGAVIFGLLDGLLIGNILTLFSDSSAGGTVGLLSWLLLTYGLYRFFNPRTLVGSFVLSLGIVALLVPLGLVAMGSRMSGFGPLAGMVGGMVFAIVLGPLGLILTFIGFWLINRGVRKQRIESAVIAQAESVRYCTSCGSQFQSSVTFCPRCGAKQTPA